MKKKKRSIRDEVSSALSRVPKIKTQHPDRTTPMGGMSFTGFNVIEDAVKVAEKDKLFNERKFKDGKTVREVWDEWNRSRE